MPYKSKQSFTIGKFQLDLLPFVAPPDNRFDAAVAIQYGADFQVRFSRSGAQKTKIGLLQLIFPQTKIFEGTTVGAWNVDKQKLSDDPIALARCLYGSDGTLIGNHSQFFAGRAMRSLSPTECWLIDTPREINGKFDRGVFQGATTTKFANYVVDLSGKNGVIFNQGIVWGYSFAQNAKTPVDFDVIVQVPREVRLKDTSEHLSAIATALKSTKDIVKIWVS
jgi:hypothetical protein